MDDIRLFIVISNEAYINKQPGRFCQKMSETIQMMIDLRNEIENEIEEKDGVRPLARAGTDD